MFWLIVCVFSKIIEGILLIFIYVDNFIVCDGIIDYNELFDVFQNVYNVGYDLVNFFVFYVIYVVGFGDFVIKKLFIGCDVIICILWSLIIIGSEFGLNGYSKMEIDVLFIWNDFFVVGGDNFSFNIILFKMFEQFISGFFDVD